MKRYIFLLILIVYVFIPKVISATTLTLTPPYGNFSVGSTFNVSLMLDTEGRSINALAVFLTFPPDKLEVVSPSVGQSIVDIWTVPPKYNNAAGTIEIEGGVPKGIIASKGVLTKITFRVKSTGSATIKFTDASQVFLNNGLATPDLNQMNNGVYQLRLPPPGGPVVSSNTHIDQTLWYSNSSPLLQFGTDAGGIEGYSYVLSSDPLTTPDNISEGRNQSVLYNDLGDGTYYFHIKSMRGGVWGGTTHFTIKIDTTKPEEFPVEILPSSRTTNTKPFIQFETKDQLSGIDRYEMKVEPLTAGAAEEYSVDESFFVEVNSPLVTASLKLGSYDVIVRSYDRAGNYEETTQRLVITTPMFQFIGEEGIHIGNLVFIPWFWVRIIGMFLLLILLFVAYKVWGWHHEVHVIHKEKKLPEGIIDQLEELKKYKEKYGKVLLILFTLMSLWSPFAFGKVEAAEIGTLELTTPLITTISKDISNKEIFYIGGKTGLPNRLVVLYSQNLLTGETFSQEVESDEYGDWFYRHSTFLTPGEYVLWVQAKDGEQFSPPSGQENMVVKQSAIVFGSNRLSYEVVYLLTTILSLIIILGLVLFIIFHYYHGRKKLKKFEQHVALAEESVRRGFALLRRDIEAELETIRRANPNSELSLEEKHKEAQLLNDLNIVQKRIGTEIWEMKKESW